MIRDLCKQAFIAGRYRRVLGCQDSDVPSELPKIFDPFCGSLNTSSADRRKVVGDQQQPRWSSEIDLGVGRRWFFKYYAHFTLFFVVGVLDRVLSAMIAYGESEFTWLPNEGLVCSNALRID